MLSEQSLRDGDLQDALAQLQDQVRKDPANVKLRVFLFQLLALLGQWERALNQLNVIKDMDAGAIPMVQMYGAALNCEVLRSEVFAGKRTPLVFGDPQQWVALALEALRLTADGEFAKAGELREQAFEAAPTTPGNVDGEAFEWLADADMRLGPIIEGIVNGRYFWIPVHNIREVHIEAPEDLRDTVWMPVHFTWANGGDTVGLIPTRYPGSEASEDNAVALARKTEWVDTAEGLYLGLGQRMLATDRGEYPLMDVRQIQFDMDLQSATPG